MRLTPGETRLEAAGTLAGLRALASWAAATVLARDGVTPGALLAARIEQAPDGAT